MRSLPLILLALVAFSVAGCGRAKMPPIKDVEVLRKDCLTLYQEFSRLEIPTNDPHFNYQTSLGIREIPQGQWSGSIKDLNPYMVCIYGDGVQIWVVTAKQKNGEAYHVSSRPELLPPAFTVSNHFVFEGTDFKGVYLVKQKI